MSTCFVIQPFDRARFDKLYEDSFRPAIEAAGLEPYRVDQDPGAAIPIEEIESGIRRSAVCFAEISTDNPNIWYELGFAIASQKPIVMVCAETRERFPFDVQHRTIIRYKSESPRDFEQLRTEITRRLQATIETQARVGSVEEMSLASPTSGLTDHELAAMIAITANEIHGDPVSAHTIKTEVERAGYTPAACGLALRSLVKKGFVSATQFGNGYDEYLGYTLNDAGFEWLENNLKRIKLKTAPKPLTNEPGGWD